MSEGYEKRKLFDHLVGPASSWSIAAPEYLLASRLSGSGLLQPVSLETGASGSSRGSTDAVGWRRAMTGSRPTPLPSFNRVNQAMAARQ
jgi:hypothetical protein